MSRILIAEVEPVYRQALVRLLASRGHDTVGTPGGPEAIGRGLTFAPDVLLTSWMLAYPYHGLHVAEVLRLVYPDMRTVLLTDFGSPDVGWDATHLQVFEVLQKPVDLGRLLQTVGNVTPDAEQGSPATPGDDSASRIAVVITDRHGAVVHCNQASNNLFEQVGEPGLQGSLKALLPAGVGLAELCQEWRPLFLGQGPPVLARARCLGDPSGGGGHCVVLLSSDWEGRMGERMEASPEDRMNDRSPASLPATYYDTDFLVRALLDLGPPTTCLGLAPARALVLDGDATRRRRTVRQLERCGLLCHSAGEVLLAENLLRYDPGIRLVLLANGLPVGDAESLVKRVYATFPDPVVAGLGAEARDRLATAGVERVLPEDWEMDDLELLIEV